jgi:hypothetical protein
MGARIAEEIAEQDHVALDGRRRAQHRLGARGGRARRRERGDHQRAENSYHGV